MLQPVDMLVERVGTEEVNLRGVKTADAAGNALNDLHCGRYVAQGYLEQAVLAGGHLRIVIGGAAGLNAAKDVDVRRAVIAAVVIRAHVDAVTAYECSRYVRAQEPPVYGLIDSAVVFVVDRAIVVVRRKRIGAEIGGVQRRLAIDLVKG